MDNGLEKKWGLPTALSMVIGIVIGSGIFFKAVKVLSLLKYQSRNEGDLEKKKGLPISNFCDRTTTNINKCYNSKRKKYQEVIWKTNSFMMNL